MHAGGHIPCSSAHTRTKPVAPERKPFPDRRYAAVAPERRAHGRGDGGCTRARAEQTERQKRRHYQVVINYAARSHALNEERERDHYRKIHFMARPAGELPYIQQRKRRADIQRGTEQHIEKHGAEAGYPPDAVPENIIEKIYPPHISDSAVHNKIDERRHAYCDKRSNEYARIRKPEPGLAV